MNGLVRTIQMTKAEILYELSISVACLLDDVEEIIQSHIINNKPVERLFISHPKFNKDEIKI